MSVVAVIGAGKLGGALARRALAAGHTVRVAGRDGSAEFRERVARAVPGAEAGSVAEAVRGADLVVLAVPLARHTEIDPTLLEGHVVVDAMNDWPPSGTTGLPAARRLGSSEQVQRHLPGATVVKALNHIGYHELDDAPLGGAPARALALATDDQAAALRVRDFIESLGFEPVDAGPLARGGAFALGTEAFAAQVDADRLEDLLAAACTAREHALAAA